MRSPTSTLGDASQGTTGTATLAGGSDPDTASDPASATIALRINGTTHRLKVDLRATLLDTLRERIGLTGTKKGLRSWRMRRLYDPY